MNTFDDPMITTFHDYHGTVPRFGRDLVVMHTIGARSGQPRIRAARGIPFRNGWVVTATAGGHPKEPLWASNLRAHPDISLEVPLPGTGIRTFEVRTTELKNPDRSEAWQLFLAASPNFRLFEERTSRVFPIFHLIPR